MRCLSAPIEVSVEVTNKCNLLCTHCYSSSGPFHYDNELTYDEITNLVDQLSAMKVFRLQLVGGEPFLRPDSINIVRYAKSKGLGVTCSTNGSFLDDTNLALLKRYGLDNMQISIDGGEPETHDRIRARKGSFNKAVDAARRAKKIGLSVTIGTTLMRYNWREVPKVVDLALSLEADSLHIMCVQPGGRGGIDFENKSINDEEWIEIIEYFREKRGELEPKIPITIQGSRFAFINKGMVNASDLPRRDPLDEIYTNCDCGKARCVVDSRGNVFPCDMLRLSDMNIRSTPFEKIWAESAALNAVRDRDVHEIPDCQGCEYIDHCKGGCPASTYNIFGSFGAADPRCAIAKRPERL